MKYIFNLAAICIIMAAGGCGTDTPTPVAPQRLVADPRPAVYLEGLYATSNATGKEVHRLFDEDATTGWQTLTGAGPDEGIMLYFIQPVQLSTVEVIPELGSFSESDQARIVVYINGSIAGSGKPGTLLQTGKQAVKSLYLRFESTGKEVVNTTQAGDAKIETNIFPASAAIAVRAVNLYNLQNQSIRVMPPRQVRGRVTAASTLAPEMAYSAANLFDARKEFAWAEGNPSDGVNETLRFELEETVHLTAVQFWNGYQRSAEHFSANTRLKDFAFGISGSPGTTYHVEDTPIGQRIELSAPLEGKNFELTVQSIYPGKKYKDLAISELVFYDGDRPFILVPEQPEQFSRTNREVAATSPLSSLLDKRIFNIVREGDVQTRQSLILRSDGTFVLYQSETYGDDVASETLADGNWEIQSADPTKATVKVFGKWNNLSQLMEYYEGTSAQNATKIFNDILTIDPETVTGQKMIGKFYRP